MSAVAGETNLGYSRQTLEGIRRGKSSSHDARSDPRTAEIYQTTYGLITTGLHLDPLFANGRWDAIFGSATITARDGHTGNNVPRTVGERAWLQSKNYATTKPCVFGRAFASGDRSGKYFSGKSISNGKQPFIRRTSNRFWVPDALGLRERRFVHEEDRQPPRKNFAARLPIKQTSAEFRLVNPPRRRRGLAVRSSIFYQRSGDQPLASSVSRKLTRATSRKRARRTLRREQAARREAEEASRSKDEFLATVSHE